ncbi:hypothetical protein [Francisella persica]
MIQELLKYTKINLNLEKINLRVFDFNISAIKCYEAIGNEKRKITFNGY